MNDSLQYIKRDPMYRSHHEGELSFSFVYAFSENYVLPISHDEVVHGKGSLFARMPGRPLAEAREHAGLPRVHVGAPGQAAAVHGPGVRAALGVVRGTLARLVAARPAVARAAARVRRRAQPRRTATHSALWARDSDGAAFSRLGAPTWNPNVVAFARRDWHGNTIVVVCNFSGVPVYDYELDLPESGVWHEVLNTDAQEYGGSGVGNLGVVHADAAGRALARAAAARRAVAAARARGAHPLAHAGLSAGRAARRRQNSSEARRPRARMHARVGVADEREQLEQSLAHRPALLGGQRREQIEQPAERVLDVPARRGRDRRR